MNLLCILLSSDGPKVKSSSSSAGRSTTRSASSAHNQISSTTATTSTSCPPDKPLCASQTSITDSSNNVSQNFSDAPEPPDPQPEIDAPNDPLNESADLTGSIDAKSTVNFNLDIPVYVPVYEHKTATQVTETCTPTVQTEPDNGFPSVVPMPVVTDDDLFRTSSHTILEEDEEQELEYTDEDLDEALSEDLVDDDLDAKTPTNEIVENVDLIPNEGHYMHMTPKKGAPRDDRNIFAVLESVLPLDEMDDTSSNSGFEENHYVEMSQGKLGSVLADEFKSNYETICISPLTTTSDQQEPVYMELSMSRQLTDAIMKPKQSLAAMSKHSNLPDILNPTQAMPLKSADSSDDETRPTAIHDTHLGFTMKSRTRFSLSDTFRPASYYLGASTPLKECAESSDSEIVSPPPIPKSPPPIEELNSNDEAFVAENFDTIKRKQKSNMTHSFDEIPKLRGSDLALFKSAEGHKTSRLSLPDHLYKYTNNGKKKLELAVSDYISLSTYSVENKMYSASIASCNTDDGSNTSSDYDLYNKLKLEAPSYISDSVYNSNRSLPIGRHSGTASETESGGENLEFRYSDSEMERRNKRRPLSEDSLCAMDLIENTFDEATAHSDFDQFLGKLSEPCYNYSESIDQTNWIHESLAKIGEIHYIKPPEVFRTDHDAFYENLTMMAKQQGRTPSTLSSNGSNNPLYDTLEPGLSRQNVVTLKEKNLTLHNAQCESEDRKSGFDMAVGNDLDQQSIKCTAPIHSRGNSNVSDGSAPYYYSDLARPPDQQEDAKMLNNQRDIEKKKQGITHIHNPLHQREPSADGKPMSAEMLNAKETLIDTRNLYENEVDKMSKSMAKEALTPTTLTKKSNNNEIGPPKCTNLKSNNNSPSANPTNNTQSHHVVSNSHLSCSSTDPGFIQVANCVQGAQIVKTNNIITSKNIISPGKKQSTSSNQQQQQPVVGVENLLYNTTSHLQSPDRVADTAGDQLWEEDALWRDRLRRVSHRHARSMDELDRIGSPNVATAVTSPNDELSSPSKSKGKLSRDVKYVNEETKTNSLRKKVYRKKASDKKSKSSLNLHLKSAKKDSDEDEEMLARAIKEDNDNDVYVQLAIDVVNNSPADLYETLLIEDPRVAKKNFELDREKIRQWDSMSSGLMKTGNGGGQVTLESSESFAEGSRPLRFDQGTKDNAMLTGGKKGGHQGRTQGTVPSPLFVGAGGAVVYGGGHTSTHEMVGSEIQSTSSQSSSRTSTIISTTTKPFHIP